MKTPPLIDFFTALKTTFRKSINQSDFSRWKKNSSLHTSWDERTLLISKLIPSNSSVLEFGAGKMTLKKHIEDTCTYTPSDFVDRGETDFLIYDLNATRLPLLNKKYDVAVFSGVLEYVNNIPRLINSLSKDIPYIITSYAINELNSGTIFRRKSGWVNDYSSKEFIHIFTNYGYKCEKKIIWNNQRIFFFKNKSLIKNTES